MPRPKPEDRRLVADRFRRIWATVQEIADHPGQLRADLARTFHLSGRQLQSDLNIIRADMRLPLVRRRGYRFVDEGGQSAASGLTLQDIMVLAQGLAAAERSLLVNGDRLRTATEKLAMFAPIHLRPLADELVAGERRAVFMALADAMLAARAVRLSMADRYGRSTVIVQPELLFPYLGYWCLMAQDQRIGLDRVYRMSAVTAVEPIAIRIERTREGAA